MRRNGSFDNGLLSQYVISGLLAFISVIYTWWITPPFPCPFNTIDFGYSTARRFAISACTAIAKVHPFVETPSSSIQHVKELSLLKIRNFTSGHTFAKFAKLRVRWDIWNLYIHLCWQSVEQQSIPALANRQTVTAKCNNIENLKGK